MTATLTGGSKENEPGSLRDNIRAMPGPAGVLFAGTFINRLGTFILPFIVIYLTHWDSRHRKPGWPSPRMPSEH